jgi:hypothetical protein
VNEQSGSRKTLTSGSRTGFEAVSEGAQRRRIAGIARVFDFVVELIGIDQIVQLFKAIVVAGQHICFLVSQPPASSGLLAL